MEHRSKVSTWRKSTDCDGVWVDVQDEKKISNSSSSDLIDFTSDIMDVFGATKQKALKNKRKSEDVQVKTNQEKHLQAKTILYR